MNTILYTDWLKSLNIGDKAWRLSPERLTIAQQERGKKPGWEAEEAIVVQNNNEWIERYGSDIIYIRWGTLTEYVSRVTGRLLEHKSGELIDYPEGYLVIPDWAIVQKKMDYSGIWVVQDYRLE